ncbi:MAG: hypothetical protein ABIB47_03715 [Candidatus Woesearchaeota archaeon]
MEIIGKVSKGSRMDQIYIPRNRIGLDIGSYAVVRPLEVKRFDEKPYFYNIKFIEPLKLGIVGEIMGAINRMVEDYENIIVTGSFLDKGFNFNDIDVIVVSEKKLDKRKIIREIENKIKIEIHFIVLSSRALIKGLSIDPLYQMMLSKCVSKKRFVYRFKPKMSYKILDLHLLKSKLLIDNFDDLNGNEKYSLIRNVVAISLFLKYKKVNKERVDKEIIKIFNLKSISEIKENMLDKGLFLKKYRVEYRRVFNKLMKGIRNGT